MILKKSLPEKWTVTDLEELTLDISYGFTAKSSAYKGNARMLRITDIQDGCVDWSQVPFCEIEEKDIEKYKLLQNDLVFARTGATVGKSFQINIINEISVYASYLIRVRPINDKISDYLKHFFKSSDYWSQITDLSAGIGQPNVNGSKLKNLKIPLAPENEQRRIAEKLDTTLARVDALNDRLARITPLLKRFRQSVLAAATSGRLTEDWRCSNEIKGLKLGQNILDIPREWNCDFLGSIINPSRPLCYGVVQPGEDCSTGIPLIRVQDMERGNVSLCGLRNISEEIDSEFKRSRVREGDLIISIVGTIGRVALVPKEFHGNIGKIFLLFLITVCFWILAVFPEQGHSLNHVLGKLPHT